MQRLITIVREDISAGYQIAQTAHAVAEYCIRYYNEAKAWKDNGNYIICLSVKEEDVLLAINDKLIAKSINTSLFYEPDVYKYTALTFIETEETIELTKQLPLAGKKSLKKNFSTEFTSV